MFKGKVIVLRSLEVISLTLVLVLLMGVFTSTVFATESPTKSTSNAYTVVTDDWGIFSESQIIQIEAAAETLTQYDVALYVNLTDEKSCTQEKTNKLAEEKYLEIFKDNRSGVLIAFSFYKEGYGNYAIHYATNVSLGKNDESKIQNLIEGCYNDYDTDSTWIVGAFEKTTNYLKNVKNTTPKSVNSDSTSSRGEEGFNIYIFLTYAFASIIIVLSLAIVFLVRNNQKNIEKFETFKDKSKAKYDKLSDSYDKVKSELAESNHQVNVLEAWKQNAEKTHPFIQDEINTMLAKEDAKNFMETHQDAETWSLESENFYDFDEMITSYENLSDLAKSFITFDMEKFEEKRQTAAKKYAEEAEKELQGIYNNCSGNRHDENELNRGVTYYDGLPPMVKMLITVTLINNLRSRHDEAHRDAVRYRNNNSYNSIHRSGFRSGVGGTFGGTFGRPGGGGTFGGSFGGRH